MSPYLMSAPRLDLLSDADDAAKSVSAMWRRQNTTVAQAEEAAAGYLSVAEVLSGDLAMISGYTRGLRAEILTTDIRLAREEAEGLSPAEIVTRYLAARGDDGTRYWLRGLAAEHDAAQRFGPRLVDELDGIDGVHDLAA
ncbi:hypothetical protein ACWHA3_02210 [Streptomyces cyaneofuscatus]